MYILIDKRFKIWRLLFKSLFQTAKKLDGESLEWLQNVNLNK